MKRITFFFLLLSYPLQAQSDSLYIDLGTQTDSTYTNSFFGLTMKTPEEFYVLSMDEIYEMAGRMEQDGKFRVRADFSQSIILFMSREDEPSQTGDFNSTFMVSAQSRKMDYQNFKDERQYLYYANEFMRDKIPGLAFEPVKEITFGGKTFLRSEAVIPVGDGDIHQVRLVKFFGDVLLDINYAFHEHEDNSVLFNTVESITFSK